MVVTEKSSMIRNAVRSEYFFDLTKGARLLRNRRIFYSFSQVSQALIGGSSYAHLCERSGTHVTDKRPRVCVGAQMNLHVVASCERFAARRTVVLLGLLQPVLQENTRVSHGSMVHMQGKQLMNSFL